MTAAGLAVSLDGELSAICREPLLQAPPFQGYHLATIGGKIVWDYETIEPHRLGHLRALYVDQFAGGYDPGLCLLWKESKSCERYAKSGHSAANTPLVPLDTVLQVIQTTNTA